MEASLFLRFFPYSWVCPTEWVLVALDSPRYSTRTHSATFQTRLYRLNTLHFEPHELTHPAFFFHLELNFKEVVLDTDAVNMFNKLLQDKALTEGNFPGSSFLQVSHS